MAYLTHTRTHTYICIYPCQAFQWRDRNRREGPPALFSTSRFAQSAKGFFWGGIQHYYTLEANYPLNLKSMTATFRTKGLKYIPITCLIWLPKSQVGTISVGLDTGRRSMYVKRLLICSCNKRTDSLSLSDLDKGWICISGLHPDKQKPTLSSNPRNMFRPGESQHDQLPGGRHAGTKGCAASQPAARPNGTAIRGGRRSFLERCDYTA